MTQINASLLHKVANVRMDHTDTFATLGLFTERAPRYTSYPTAPQFSANIDIEAVENEMAALDRNDPVSLYVHIPFCRRLCWYCACRTQGTRTIAPVDGYLEGLKQEIAEFRSRTDGALNVGQVHWGGGTPTILSPNQMQALGKALQSLSADATLGAFSVEIDPTEIDESRVKALLEIGMTRASIGIQDFAPAVQDAIGRPQSIAQTRECVSMLRDGGVKSVNADMVYGLPHQTELSVLRTLDHLLELSPDRVALFGYAHVPWMARRQRLIEEAALPDGQARFRLASRMAEVLVSAGFVRIGIDHFAKPEDDLAKAATEGHLRRNFQGYTTDNSAALIGFGASAISSVAGYYLQNAASTAAYLARVASTGTGLHKGLRLSDDDKLRARAIEMLMCGQEVCFDQLAQDFGPAGLELGEVAKLAVERFPGFVELDGMKLRITPQGLPLTRLIASCFDAYLNTGARYSQAS